ncbi:SANT [Musa troglodytarum]|uniref:SANT n=1 Tax=Musa troglodytarum TaxID=320322 RepID=A0A9E7L4C7_9LILI|nr:SANT [Musa troglodytarum]
MVLQRRLDCESSGYQSAVMPHVPRSARGKRSIRKKVEGKPMCAFDLLATVAGKLLSERENSLASCDNTGTSDPAAAKDTIKQEQIDSNERSIKFEAFDLLSCNEHSKSSIATSSGPTSPIVKSEVLDEDAIGGELKFIEDSRKIGCGVAAVAENFGNVRLSSCSMESHECKDGSKKLPQGQQQTAGNALYRLDGPVDLDAKHSVLGSSDSSVEVPLHRNNISRNTLLPKQEDGMDLAACNDDDENSSGCTHPTVVTNKTSRMQHIGDRRIRKLLASKFWRVAPTMLQDTETSNYDVEQKHALQGKRMRYTRQRTQRNCSKRRKLFDRCSQTVHRQPQQDKSHAMNHQNTMRTVLDAVTAILGGGLCVGVLLQGKKVRDDNKTLHQVGISHGDKLDNLGFTLEPNPRQSPAPLTSSEDPNFLSIGCAPEPLDRISPIAPAVVDQGGPDATQFLQICPESDHDSVLSPTDAASSPEKTKANSLAQVAVPPMDTEALAMVPLRNKPKRSEATQRRVRRPFSVAEVEALVHAVEKLGTGRWRDVKLCAFENAKHRTYVDLKDKWKTLVHTARISPQQRRGEPVPQELLDRVLSAQAYWSQQQAKLLLKPPASAETRLLL